MSVDVGTRLGSLEIIALLGKGGMGEVYRARDTKLKREVAIKILPEEFSQDPDRVARFNVKPKCSPRSITRTPPRFTIYRKRRARASWSSNLWKARRWQSGSRVERFRSRRR